MAENNKEVREIDLIELFQMIGRGIKNTSIVIIRIILHFIVFGFKRWVWLVFFVFVGGLLGYLQSVRIEPFYSSSLVAQSNGISNIEMIEYINDLNQLVLDGNVIALANELNITDSSAMKIKTIRAYDHIVINKDGIGNFVDYEGLFDPIDTTKSIVQNRLIIQVEVYDVKVFADIKDGLLNYINKIPYVIQLNKIRKNELIDLISATTYEISKLDSLQNVDYFSNNRNLSTSNENKLLFISENDKPMYYKDKIALVKQNQSYKKELEMFTSPITIVKGFTQLSKVDNFRNYRIIKFGLLFGVIGYIGLLMIYNKTKIISLIED